MAHKTLTCFLLFLGLTFCLAQQKTTDEYFDQIRPIFTGDLAFETTSFVEKYWRVAGNTGFNKTIYRIAEQLEAAGYVLEKNSTGTDRLTYRIEKRPMKHPTWEPVDATLTIVGQDSALLQQRTNRNMVYLNSVSTPDGGVTAELIHVENPKSISTYDLKGKIVFTEDSAHKIFKEAIIDQGALGIITYNNPAYLQPEKNTSSIQFRSFRHQEKSNAWGIALSFAAKEKLKAALANGKVQLNVNIQTKIYPSEELTIVADVIGSERPKERLVCSAHIQEPGANDNATGVGTQLEMAVLTASLITNNEIDLARTLTFLWGDEIVSTHRYITEDKKRAEDIKWGISLDMVGENTAITGGSFLIEKMPDPSAIWTRGKDKHSEWGGRVLKLEEMKPHYLNDFIIRNFKKQGAFADWEVNTNPFEGGSDHTPFLNADIPGLLLWHFTDQFYHTDNDRIDKVSQGTMKNVGIGALASAFTLLNADSNTALELLETITQAAWLRLEDEFQIGRKNVENGSNKADEIKILKAWEDWYVKTMQTVSDIDTGGSTNLASEIEQAQSNLKALVQRQIKNLD